MNELVLDFETTNNMFGNPTYENRILLSVWRYKGQLKHEWGEPKKLLEDVKECDLVIAHNAKFELKWLKHHGIHPYTLSVYDTMLAQNVLDSNVKQPLDLGSVCKRWGLPSKDPYVDIVMKAGVCPSELPESFLLARCKKDVLTTWKLWKKQVPYLEEHGLTAVADTKFMFCRCLADIEGNGMCLDGETVEKEYEQCLVQLTEVQRQLDEFTGGINHNSPKQVAEYLYDVLGFAEPTNYKGQPDRTPAGGRKTGTDVIARLKPETEEQHTYLALYNQYSLLSNDMSKALEKFKQCVDSGSYLYANFTQHVTKTHRLSSTGTEYKIQFQNLHRKYKKIFKARHEGWNVAEADQAQLEFRVAGYLGNDVRILQAINDGEDIHRYTASKLFNMEEKEVDEDQRTAAKADTFKPLNIAA